jgi:trigger factor
LINGIKKIQIPELNEELIKKVTKEKVNNEADLRAEIRKDIQGYYDQKTEDIIHDKITNAIIRNNDFTPPAALVNNVLVDLIKAEEEAVKKRGYAKHDKAESLKRLTKVAEYNVKWYLIKDAIQKKENIALSEEEVHNLAAQDAEKTGIAVDKLVNYYKSSSYGDKIIDKKLFEFLKEKNTITFIEPNNYSQIEKKDES